MFWSSVIGELATTAFIYLYWPSGALMVYYRRTTNFIIMMMMILTTITTITLSVGQPPKRLGSALSVLISSMTLPLLFQRREGNVSIDALHQCPAIRRCDKLAACHAWRIECGLTLRFAAQPTRSMQLKHERTELNEYRHSHAHAALRAWLTDWFLFICVFLRRVTV